MKRKSRLLILKATCRIGWSLAFGVFISLASASPADAQVCRFVVHLTGDEVVPPRDTDAIGQFLVTVNLNDTIADYKFITANIDNITTVHLHVAPFGVNGPARLSLAGPFPPAGGDSNGVLATGSFTSFGASSLYDMITLAIAGNVYVDAHTNDGVPPTNTGEGDFPGGEIRGQLRPSGKRCAL